MDDKRFLKLAEAIKNGSPEQKDAAAREISEARDITMIENIVELLKEYNPMVRGVAAIIISVYGVQYTKKLLIDLQDEESDHTVRITGMLGVKYFGKITYDKLKEEIKNYSSGVLEIEEPEIKKPSEPPEKEKSAVKRKSVKKKQKPGTVKKPEEAKKKKKILWPVIITLFSFVIIIIAVAFFAKNRFGTKTVKPVSRPKTVAEKLTERNRTITDFKAKNLSPETPESKRPFAAAVESMYGDTYESVVKRIYTMPIFEETGMNTVLASWRKINFPEGRDQRSKYLFGKETSSETLIFPNLPGMHLKYNLKEGTLAREAVLKPNKDVKIYLIVDKVTVK